MASTDQDTKRFELGLVQILASAFAAVFAAVAASRLGLAGTLVGAALTSVIATIAAAVYEHFFHRTSHQVAQVRHLIARAAVPRAGAADPYRAAGMYRLHRRPRWQVFLATVGVIFTLAVVGISLLELSLGQSLSSLLGASQDSRSSLVQVVHPAGGTHHSPGTGAVPTASPLAPAGTPAAIASASAAPQTGAAPSPSPSATSGAGAAPSPAASTGPAPAPSPSATSAASG